MFLNLARDVVPDGPNQLWNGNITYVAVASGCVYVALILDAWSRRVVGYAIGRTIDGPGSVHPNAMIILPWKPPDLPDMNIRTKYSYAICIIYISHYWTTRRRLKNHVTRIVAAISRRFPPSPWGITLLRHRRNTLRLLIL